MIAPMPAAAAFLLAATAVALMGFAIQRGGTCTVAAVDEVVSERRATRLAAMLEASLWVAGGLALARLFDLMGSAPGGFAVDGYTFAGGALLGLGAWVNRACVFGAVARFGNGEWAYALTPPGFLAGCASVAPLFGRGTAPGTSPSPLLDAAFVAAPLFVVYAAWRVLPACVAAFGAGGGGVAWLRARVWAPHAATIVIGATFVVAWLAQGRWAYTDLLADLARGMPDALPARTALLVVLLSGAAFGGWSAGRWASRRGSVFDAARCFAGGVLMGWGSLLIPGSNDGLILVGLPLLQPHAWIAFATMCAAIAVALLAQRAWRLRSEATLVS